MQYFRNFKRKHSEKLRISCPTRQESNHFAASVAENITAYFATLKALSHQSSSLDMTVAEFHNTHHVMRMPEISAASGVEPTLFVLQEPGEVLMNGAAMQHLRANQIKTGQKRVRWDKSIKKDLINVGTCVELPRQFCWAHFVHIEAYCSKRENVNRVASCKFRAPRSVAPISNLCRSERP
eukprot:IDg8514t1